MHPKLPIPSPLINAHVGKINPLIIRFKNEKKIHHSLLITGLTGVGKKEIALYLSQTLFCDSSVFAASIEESGELFGGAFSSMTAEKNGITPCGTCASCKRAQDQQWIDFYYFEPETGDEDRLGTHKIEIFRDLKVKMGFGPSEEPFKVVIITDADRMTQQAANSILKILEEPPEKWIFILTASDSSKILPTLVSRCIEIKLSPLTSEQIFNSLKEMQGSHFQSQSALIAARAGMGSLSRAQSFLDEDTWKTRDMILGLLSNPAAEWMKLVEQLSYSHKQLSLGLDLLESVFSDLLHYRIQGDAHLWIHEDQKGFLLQWANGRGLDTQEIVALIEKIAENRRYVGMTLNAKLLAQEILVPVVRTLFS